jgi:hypothetical protein
MVVRGLLGLCTRKAPTGTDILFVPDPEEPQMSAETDEIQEASSELTHAMARFVRALDALGDEDLGKYISENLPDRVDELAARLDAALGFSE